MGDTRERAVPGRKEVGFVGCTMRERTGSKEVKKVLMYSTIVPTWMWNECQRSKIPAVEIK